MKVKNSILIGLTGLICFVCALLASETEYVGYISLPLGRVYLQKVDGIDWSNAPVKMQVYEKDKVKTLEKSRCEISLVNRRIFRIGEKTIVELVLQLGGGEDFLITSGKAWINIFFPDPNRQITIRTPTAVCAIRGTVYRLSCDLNHSNYRVYEGSIAVTPLKDDGKELEDSTFHVKAGEEFTIVKNFEEYKRQQEEAFKKFEERELDEFERFFWEEQEEFEEYDKKDLEAFEQFKSFHYALTKFDQTKDQKIDWVRWNLERDEKVKK